MQVDRAIENSNLGPFAVCLATARAHARRTTAYLIEIVRWPVYPLLYFVILLLTYRIAGRESVQGVSPEAFLLVGVWGMVLWTSAIWESGYAIEHERREGTLLSLFLTPASRSAVIVGYALGSMIAFVLPTMMLVAITALAFGARFDVADPAALVLAALALPVGSLALGYLLSGAFVLTRRANMIANFIQSPIYLLSGMVVPIEDLPGPLQWFAAVFPISAGMDALRAALLRGATLSEISGDLMRFGIVTLVALAAGRLLLGRVEHVAKRGGQFDFD